MNEIYQTPAGVVNEYPCLGNPMAEVPEHGITVRVTKIRQGRNSTLLFDVPGNFQAAGLYYEVSCSQNMPDLVYVLSFQVTNLAGNELPTKFLQGGGGCKRGMSAVQQDYVVPVDQYRLSRGQEIPALRIQYAWGKGESSAEGYLFVSDAVKMQNVVPLNWRASR